MNGTAERSSGKRSDMYVDSGPIITEHRTQEFPRFGTSNSYSTIAKYVPSARKFPFSRDLPNDLLSAGNSTLGTVGTPPGNLENRPSATSKGRQPLGFPTSLVSETESFHRRRRSESSMLQNALTSTFSARRTVPRNYPRYLSGPDGPPETRPERRGW